MKRLATALILMALLGQGRSSLALGDEPIFIQNPAAVPPIVNSPMFEEQLPIQESVVIEEPGVSPVIPGPKESGGGWFRNHKWCCWTTHNTLGCGSLKAECTFFFGSCRAFYGEPCMKGPPGDEDYSTGSRGCGCP